MTGRTSGPWPEPDEQRPAGFGPPPAPFAPPAPPALPAPPAPPAPFAPSAPRSGRRRRLPRPVAAVGAALALLAALLLIGGGAYRLTVRGGPAQPLAGPSGSPSIDQGDGKGPGGGPDAYDPNAGIRAGEARVWVRDNQAEVAGSGVSQYGPWRVGDTVVSAIPSGFTGYAAADGKEKWKLPLQTPLCGVPPAPSAQGKIVVGVKESTSEGSPCTHLQQIDLATGRAGWKVPLPPENKFDTTTQFELAISGDTVVVARAAVMSGFSVTDGHKLFGTSSPNGCYPSAVAGGSRLIGIRHCPDPNDVRAPGQAVVEELDPATGAARWSYKYAPDWTVGRVLSIDPLVIAAHHKDKKTWNLTAFAADGTVRSQSTPAFGVSGRCNGFGNASGFQECYAVAADADSLYIGAGKPGTTLDTEVTDQVVAVDLNTGKERWRTAEQPKGRTVWPLAVEEGRVLTYVTPGNGEAGAVVSLAATDGAAQPALQSPAAARGAQGVFYPHGVRIAWAGGRLFLLNGRVNSPEPRKASRAILSFGK
ncbi:outer membrane protein assembly factor BamB family protein [Streptomyces sp. NBC_00273]|uniref:outer membrane protein assembly factor BamB family protein n=1 Tax=Streptomyces sp. NBC_00273 TaxID=2903644 RepID=UPI002E28C6E0|nr:PQQ-binding-like beta-propeller repeat protein [Streptomyces sp. NBC_00273]